MFGREGAGFGLVVTSRRRSSAEEGSQRTAKRSLQGLGPGRDGRGTDGLGALDGRPWRLCTRPYTRSRRRRCRLRSWLVRKPRPANLPSRCLSEMPVTTRNLAVDGHVVAGETDELGPAHDAGSGQDDSGPGPVRSGGKGSLPSHAWGPHPVLRTPLADFPPRRPRLASPRSHALAPQFELGANSCHGLVGRASPAWATTPHGGSGERWAKRQRAWWSRCGRDQGRNGLGKNVGSRRGCDLSSQPATTSRALLGHLSQVCDLTVHRGPPHSRSGCT